jgi:hypothetical protein
MIEGKVKHNTHLESYELQKIIFVSKFIRKHRYFLHRLVIACITLINLNGAGHFYCSNRLEDLKVF